jgi:hypothetical protein
MLSTSTIAAGWTVTVTLSAYPPETLPVGYDSPELGIFISGGPDDSPELSVTVIPHDIPLDVKVTSITVSATMVAAFLVSDTITHTFEVPYNETPTIPDSIIPVFNSVFSYYDSLAK